MSLKQNTHRQQSDLAEYCRTERLSDTLEVRKERVHHYRRLVFNVVSDSLESAYPLTRNLLDDADWHDLVHAYFSQHKSQSPQVWQMPKEFYEFVEKSDLATKEKYPHMTDLLRFEWMEVEVFMMEDMQYPLLSNGGSWLHDPLALNPEFRIVRLGFPVHLKNAKSISHIDKGEFYVLLYREKDTGKVQFLDLSPFFAMVIENLSAGLSLKEIFTATIKQIPTLSLSVLEKNTLPFIQKMRDKKFVLGFAKKMKA